jgi:hypothetical protein
MLSQKKKIKPKSTTNIFKDKVLGKCDYSIMLFKNYCHCYAWWCMPLVPVTWEAEAGGQLEFQTSPGNN